VPRRDGSGVNSSRAQKLALTGLLVNLALAAVKLVTGIVGHSNALIADAVESVADIVGSAVIWGGLHIAAKPADQDHPYGHGKAEALAALIVAMIVFGAGVEIAAQAIGELVTPSRIPAAFTLWVLVAVVIVKEVMFRVVRRAGRELGSGGLHTDAWHHRSDAITSAAAFIGISASLVWQVPRADAAAALAASVIIMFNGVRLFRVPVQELMDKVPADIVADARAAAGRVEGVIDVEKTAARKSGMRYWIDMHVRVDPEMSVREAHALSHRVKDKLRAEMPSVADVLVHIEPAGGPDADPGT